MTPERWNEIQRQLHVALSLTVAERRTFLESIGATDGELRRELESLLAGEAADPDFMNTPVLSLLENLPESVSVPNAMLGRILGAYRVTGQLGVGGMGEVYLAVRADGHYDQQVALKIVRPGLGGGEFSSIRFRNERQILAKLDHQNIAKILDGGTTEDGLPYFVMELIDGLPITEYCDQNRLSIEERFRLFRTVCSAVHYAHQHLVVHRDIKPTNILVTPDGIPKLLDFGIAKMLSPDSAAENATVTGVWTMTPEYASPEQLQGEPITTASDLYSLGLVLYELLTGQRAHRFPSRMPHEMARVVLESEPDKPSSAVFRKKAAPDNSPEKPETESIPTTACDLRGFSTARKLHRRLAGDADNIVLKALRKETGERYASADQLSEDIRRHLEGRPITASKGTTAYRFRKYVLRHKAGVAGAALIFLILVTGIIVTVREARIAKRNELRAEQRFNDVRKLANSLIFDIHDSIQNLPGSTPARKILLEEAVQYLDSLSRESSDDVSLQRELAKAYQRIGLLQGNAQDSNLGQTETALKSLQKSLDLFESVAKADPKNTKDRVSLAHAHRILSVMLGNSGRPGARDQAEESLAITATLAKADPDEGAALLERAGDFAQLASTQDEAGDLAGAADSYKKTLSILDDLWKRQPQDKQLQETVGVNRVRMGITLSQLGQRNQAIEISRSGIGLLKSLAEDRNDARSRRLWSTATAYLGGIQLMNGDFREALASNRQVHAVASALQAADPENVLYLLDVAGNHGGMGTTLTHMGSPREGLAELDQALEIFEKQRSRDSTYADLPYWLGQVHIFKGEAYSALGQSPAALEEYRKGAASFESLMKGAVGNGKRCDLAASYAKVGNALVAVGNEREASSFYSKALQISEPLASAKLPNTLALYVEAEAYAGMGTVAAKSAQTPGLGNERQVELLHEKCAWFRRSIDAWQHIQNPGPVAPSGYGGSGFDAVDIEAIRRGLHGCTN